MSNKKRNLSSGYLILEALISIVILGVLVVSIFPTINFMLRRGRRSKYDAQASVLLQEGMEATYNIFTSNWDAYTPGDYDVIPAFNGTSYTWTLEPPTGIPHEARFTRIIKVEQVCRDGSGNVIEVAGCPPDANSKKITTTITWDEPGAQPISAKLLLVKLN